MGDLGCRLTDNHSHALLVRFIKQMIIKLKYYRLSSILKKKKDKNMQNPIFTSLRKPSFSSLCKISIVFIFSSFMGTAAMADVSATEREALMALYEATNGVFWESNAVVS
jgi:hypothetical protein